MIHRDDLPPTPEWICEPRCNPLDCDACETTQPNIPPNIVLGAE